jgi:hypothetical protein
MDKRIPGCYSRKNRIFVPAIIDAISICFDYILASLEKASKFKCGPVNLISQGSTDL